MCGVRQHTSMIKFTELNTTQYTSKYVYALLVNVACSRYTLIFYSYFVIIIIYTQNTAQHSSKSITRKRRNQQQHRQRNESKRCHQVSNENDKNEYEKKNVLKHTQTTKALNRTPILVVSLTCAFGSTQKRKPYCFDRQVIVNWKSWNDSTIVNASASGMRVKQVCGGWRAHVFVVASTNDHFVNSNCCTWCRSCGLIAVCAHSQAQDYTPFQLCPAKRDVMRMGNMKRSTFRQWWWHSVGWTGEIYISRRFFFFISSCVRCLL